MCINKKGQLFVADPGTDKLQGRLWRIEETGAAVMLKAGMGNITGISASPNGKLLYVAENEIKKIWVFDIDATGNLSGQRQFAGATDFGYNGLKCDYKGNLYACRPGKGAVAIYNMLGRQFQEISLKGKQPRNLAFGGTDNKTCYVSLPDRGTIEKFRTDVPGL